MPMNKGHAQYNQSNLKQNKANKAYVANMVLKTNSAFETTKFMNVVNTKYVCLT